MIFGIFIAILALALGFKLTFFFLRVCGKLLALLLCGGLYIAIGFVAATLLGLGAIAFAVVIPVGIIAIIRGLARA